MVEISKTTFKWAHFGVIMYHLLTALSILILVWKNKGTSFTIVKSLCLLMIIISLLGLIPIFKKYEDNEIIIKT